MNPARAALASRIVRRVPCAAVLPTRREQPVQDDNDNDGNNQDVGAERRRRRAARLDAAANARRLVEEINLGRVRRRQQPVLPPPDNCAICQLPMLDSGQPLVAMRCSDPPQHVLHEDCLMQWRRDPRAEAATLCPVCGKDPRLVMKTRRHMHQVQLQMDRDRRAWCLPRKWCGYVQSAVLWGGGALLAVLTLLFLISVVWTAVETYWSPVSVSLDTAVVVMQAPESRDPDLL